MATLPLFVDATGSIDQKSYDGAEYNYMCCNSQCNFNLGMIINSGEKLQAMVGDLRDECFDGIGTHRFLEETDIPTRRFAREQVAAQILAQVFSLDNSDGYTRTRHVDLQSLFKRNSDFSEHQKEVVGRLKDLLDLLVIPFGKMNVLRNRAITVSTVLLAWKCGIKTEEKAFELAEFIKEFVSRLKWQVAKGLSVDPEYHYLIEFQRNISQASAESSFVEARAQLLQEEFNRWRESKELKGDSEWKDRFPGEDPTAASLL